ncbi:MAG: flagellar protein FlaG [Nitrospirota bacterium]
MSVGPITSAPLPISKFEANEPGGRSGRSQGDISAREISNVEADKIELKTPVKEVVERLNTIEDFHDRGIRFSVDEETEKVVIKIVDSNTNEVIRQIPPEEVLNMIRHLDEFQGLLINKRG